jgi:hypothetical protein
MNLIHFFREMVVTLEDFQLNILLKLKNQEGGNRVMEAIVVSAKESRK